MKIMRFLLLTALVAFMAGLSSNAQAADSAEGLKADSRQALELLTSTNPIAKDIASKAKGALIFPNIVKAGLIFGGAYGEGVMLEGNTFQGFYNSLTASFGWQAGAQSYGYVVFLMNDKAINYIKETRGWEIGVGPTVALVDAGVAKNLSTTSLQQDAYAFIFDQQGLMASLSIEGTKITPITHP